MRGIKRPSEPVPHSLTLQSLPPRAPTRRDCVLSHVAPAVLRRGAPGRLSQCTLPRCGAQSVSNRAISRTPEPDTPGPPPWHRLTPRDTGTRGLLTPTASAVRGALVAKLGCRLGPGNIHVRDLRPHLQPLLCYTLFCLEAPCLRAGSSPTVGGGGPHTSRDSGLSPSSQLWSGGDTAWTGLLGLHPCGQRGKFLRVGRRGV